MSRIGIRGGVPKKGSVAILYANTVSALIALFFGSVWANGAVAAQPLQLRWFFGSPASLEEVAVHLEDQYPDLDHITPPALERLQSEAADVIVLDVREEKEYAVSRLPGAVRVSPAANESHVLELLAGETEEAHIVFYCSVGVRSSKLADRVSDALRSAGVQGVSNLRGGVFAWHNQGRALENGNGGTIWVHPYSEKWGRLLTHTERASSMPR